MEPCEGATVACLEPLAGLQTPSEPVTRDATAMDSAEWRSQRSLVAGVEVVV